MDLRPIALALRLALESSSCVDVHQVLAYHRPAPRWWRVKCSACGGRWPCLVRELALDVLTRGMRVWAWSR